MNNKNNGTYACKKFDYTPCCASCPHDFSLEKNKYDMTIVSCMHKCKFYDIDTEQCPHKVTVSFNIHDKKPSCYIKREHAVLCEDESVKHSHTPQQ